MESRTIIILAIVINAFHKIDATLNVIPRDTEVKINDTSYMNCSTSLQADLVQWRRGKNYVYTGTTILEPYNDGRFSVEINSLTGASNLVIRSVQPSDAGKYECSEDARFGETRSAQLIVLDGDPICKSNMHSDGVIGPNSCGVEPEEVKLSCSITYHGNSLPVLQWKASGDNQSIIDGRINVTSGNNEVSYTLTMKSALALNNSSFVCQTMGTSDKPYTCSSEAINILFLATEWQTRMSLLALPLVPALGVIGVIIYFWRKRKVAKRQLVLDEIEQRREQEEQQRLLEIAKTQHDAEELERQQQIIALPVKYKSDIGLALTVKTKPAKWGKKVIYGLTILDNELFVVSEHSSEVEVYDSRELDLSRRWNLKKLIDPWDIGSCKRNKCLYIFNFKGYGRKNKVLRIDPNGKLIKKWSTGEDHGWSLSVTDESNVILTILRKNKLNEYSPDGELIREINLALDESIRNPWKAIKLNNGHFVVSYGSTKRDLHRVCIVDEYGKLKNSFGGNHGCNLGQMNCPSDLCVDGDGFVMVADRENGRILLLDSDLELRIEILSKVKHELRRPMRILLDEANGRLFVADNELGHNGRILRFKFCA